MEPSPNLSTGTYLFFAAIIVALVFFSPEIFEYMGWS